MKKLVTTLCSCVCALSALAQFQLNYANAAGQLAGTSVIKTDMINRILPVGGGIPTFVPASNVLWNLNNVTYETAIDYIDYDTSNGGVFAPAEYSSEVVYYLTSLMPYTTHPKFEIKSTGTYTYGEHMDRQAFSIYLVTGGLNDSLVITNQDILYSSPVTNIPYPAIPGTTNWMNTITYTTNELLTYVAQGYNQTPITKVTHATRKDTVVGYGRIVAKRIDNLQGGETDVIMVKEIITTQDSFFDAGVPMPANILNTFGITQGQTSNVYRYNFMRAGQVTAMLTVSYDNPNFTGLHDISIHREGIPFAASVGEVAENSQLQVYPNPASGSINVSIENKMLTNCDYNLVNITGQSVLKGSAAVNSGSFNLHTQDLPSGMYHLVLSSKNEVIGSAPVTIAK